MATGMEVVKSTASKRGYTAVAVTAGSVGLLAIGWSIMGTMGIFLAAWLTYRWFTYRAKWGLRF